MSGSVGGYPLNVILAPASPAQGQVLYYNGSAWVGLAPGTSGYVLKTAGASANPAWGTLSASDVGALAAPADGTTTAYKGGQAITAPTSISGATATDPGHYILTLSADATYTFPAASTKRVLIFFLNGHTLTLTAFSGDSFSSTLGTGAVSSCAGVGSVTIVGGGSTTNYVDGV